MLIELAGTPPPEAKKIGLGIVNLIILCTSTETVIYWKFKDEV